MIKKTLKIENRIETTELQHVQCYIIYHNMSEEH